MTPQQLRDHILKTYPKSRLNLLGADQRNSILAQTPWLPWVYLSFLEQVGSGVIGDARYSIYQGPVEPDFIFDEETARSLGKVVLIGDDFAGTHEAFAWSEEVAHFGYVDSSRPKFEAHTQGGLFEFVVDWYGVRP
jgi:hypothetical protein